MTASNASIANRLFRAQVFAQDLRERLEAIAVEFKPLHAEPADPAIEDWQDAAWSNLHAAQDAAERAAIGLGAAAAEMARAAGREAELSAPLPPCVPRGCA